MLRGTTTFVCDDCGHKFKGMDMEWGGNDIDLPSAVPRVRQYAYLSAGVPGLEQA